MHSDNTEQDTEQENTMSCKTSSEGRKEHDEHRKPKPPTGERRTQYNEQRNRRYQLMNAERSRMNRETEGTNWQMQNEV